MDIVNILRSKNINVIEIPKWGIFLRKQWEDNFADHMNSKEKKEIYLHDHGGCCGYLWHLFSYEKRKCLQGEEAEKIFNSECKSTCYVFYQHTNYALILENADILNSNDLQEESDIYVTDKEFNWTYVKTHEGDFGPYFSRKNIKNKIK